MLLISPTVGRLLVPRDYEDLLAYYTKHGYRVIAIAGKSVEGLSWLKAQKLKRCVSSYATGYSNPPPDSGQPELGSKPSPTYASWD